METQEQPVEKSARKKLLPLKAEMIIALSAVFVSVATLFVYIYQAKIMQGQQHAAVWPHVEWQYIQRTDEGFILKVINKGVGPAIIKSTTMTWDGQPIKNARELIRKFVSTDSINLYYSTLDDIVLSPSEQVEIFHVYVEDEQEFQKLFQKLKGLYSKLTYEICYCSIYDDCWLYRGKGQKLFTCE